MAYKQNPGRGPMMKTGKGVPSALLQIDPTDPVEKKKKDAISGRKIPEGATFGPTKTSTDEYGAKVYSTDYSKKGTTIPAGKDLGPDFKPTKEQTRKANERIPPKGGSTPSVSGTVRQKIYSGKTAGVKSTFGDDKISQKAFTVPKLSRIDEVNIKRFDREAKKEEAGERKTERDTARIKKVKEYRKQTGFTPSPQTEQQAKTAKDVKKRMKRSELFGKISGAFTPSGKSSFKPGCFTD